MKIGIIQPYFLPYIAYFSLINLVDRFVYYDDVQYIRRGWVNRNRVKMKNEWIYLTLPVQKAPLTSKINEIRTINNEKKVRKIKITLEHCYKKTPFYEIIKEMVFKHIQPNEKISKINISLLNEICNYLEIDTKMYISSEIQKDEDLNREEKIIEICKILKGDHYINPIGGINLYSKERFQNENLKLNFLKIGEIVYPQGEYNFISNLSIIDVLMWNSKDDIKKMLNYYTF